MLHCQWNYSSFENFDFLTVVVVVVVEMMRMGLIVLLVC
jgi:hypothetical protein